MSKCDLVIQFDRPDRQFSGGDQVTGTASMRVNRDVKCRGVMVKGLWKTHGRGNVKSEEYHSETFTSGHLKAGQEYEFPFKIPAPDYPTTYHGTYLNVDHYVQFRVDIPWAFDPKLEEEFLLSPTDGERYAQHLNPLATVTESKPGWHTQLTFAGVAAVILGFFALFGTSIGFALFFWVVGGLLLALNARRALAERKLGRVEIKNFTPRLVPGATAEGELVFTPRSGGSINEISVELSGAEVCVSGSGSNKTTHRHELFKNKTVLMNDVKLLSGVTVRVPLSTSLPATDAYTVKLGDNQILWSAVFHIDIPRWPDWVGKEEIQVIPGDSGIEFVQDSETQQSGAADEAAMMPIAAAVASPGQQSGSSIDSMGAESQLADEQSIPVPGLRNDLAEVARDLQDSDRFGDEAAKKVELLAAELFEIQVVVDRINPTHGYFSDDRYEDGQTVVGVVKGTDIDVIVQMPRDYNEQLESVHHSEVWTGQGVIIKWDALYSRLEMMGF